MILEISKLAPKAVLVMVWVDQLDASTSTVFKTALSDLDDAVEDVIVDLTRVRFVDSAGLSQLLALQRRLYATDVQLCVCGLTRTVQALFELMQVSRLIKVYPSRSAAMTNFGIASGE